MKTIEENVYLYIQANNLIEKNDNLVLAVSGGADSIFMLYILVSLNKKYNLNLNFVVAHLNHMIRDEAKTDLDYVKKCADELNLKFFSKAVNIKEISSVEKRSEEEVGREERYKFLNDVGEENFGKDNYKICTAHNLNDNTETIFLNLMRGTGIDGLKGIELINNNIVRPVLIIERKDIEEYLNLNKIKYIVDRTNLESEYTRNSIRNELLPLIKEKYNDNIDHTFYRMSEILRDEDLFLDNITNKILEDIIISVKEKDNQKIENKAKKVKKEVKLDLVKFNELEIVLKRRILRKVLKEDFNTYKDISKINIDDAIKIAYNNIGNKYTMLNKDIKFAVLRGEITISN